MGYNISLFLALFALGVIYLICHGMEKELTEKQYVLHTYMYILLGIIISSLTWTILDNCQNIQEAVLFEPFKFIAIFILSFLSLFTVLLTSNDSYIIKNTAWGVFMICIGLISYISYKINVMNNKMQTILLELIAIVGILSYVAYSYPLDVFNSWGTPLAYILGTVIVIECLDLIFLNHSENTFLTRNRIYGLVTVLLFSGFILYDTQKILRNAEDTTLSCDSKNQWKCADYPVASLGLFLDLINMFTGLSGMNR
jgi:FtsH-binding integral membrane protein